MTEEILTISMSIPLVLAAVTLSLWWVIRRPRDIPPGPLFTLPILGNLLQVGSDPVKSFRKMRIRYGDVFSLYFANRLVVVMNGLDNIKEALVKNGDIFSDRPKLYTLDILSKDKGILGCNGSAWKEQRKLAVMTLKNLGMGKNILECKIQEEITALVTELTESNGEAINIRQLISSSVCNVISSMVFGKRFEFDDPKFVKFLKIAEESISIPTVLAFYPLLRFLPGDTFRFKQVKQDIERVLIDLVDSSLEEHMAQYDEYKIDDFISAYIKEMKSKEAQGETNSSIDKENLRYTIWGLFIAGTETITTTILWLLLYFLHFPEVQDKCIEEIQHKVGCKRLISLKDKLELPYLEATIMETLRYADILPFTLRGISRDFMWNGYRIPKDALLMPVIDSVMADPDIWGDPQNFRPDRFLDENGRLIKSEEYVAFLFGPRNCIGESLAKMELFLFLGTMIQKFQFVKAEGFPLPTLDPVLGITQAPQPYRVRAVLREPKVE